MSIVGARLLAITLTGIIGLAGCASATRPADRPPREANSRASTAEPLMTPIRAGALPAETPGLPPMPPLPFLENVGQADPRVSFVGQAGGMTAYYGEGMVAYGLVGHDPERLTDADRAGIACWRALTGGKAAECPEPPAAARWWLTQELVGARPAAPISVGRAMTEVSLLVPPAPHPSIPTHHRLAYRDAWPGIDVVIDHASARAFKATYLVAPDAEPSQIRLRWRGATARLGEDGTLVLTTPLGIVTERAPIAWQERNGEQVPVTVRFAVLDLATGAPEASLMEVGLELEAYDAGLPLVIDPAIEYASYIGGSDGLDAANDVVVDSAGRAYVAGSTRSTDATFPDGDGFGAIPGIDRTYNGFQDVFVVWLSADGTAIEYATYLGGARNDFGTALALDGAGRLFVAGGTISDESSFPDGDGFGTIPGAVTTYIGSRTSVLTDAFVLRLSANGNAIEYATYLGGTITESATDLAVDVSGRAYVTGTTQSPEATFPDGDGFGAIPGVRRTRPGGLNDAFAIRLNADGTVIEYATYLGGAGDDRATGIAVDINGRAYVAGQSDSDAASFPYGDGIGAIPGADRSANGALDGFVLRLNTSGTAVEYASYIGGSGADVAVGLAVDSTGRAVVAGHTASTATTFPDGDGFGSVTGADTSHNGGLDTYVVRLDTGGTAFEYATFIGGSVNDTPGGIVLDTTGRAIVAGRTRSLGTTFPDGDGFGTIPGADQTPNGLDDAYVVRLSGNGLAIEYASFLGGSASDGATNVAVSGAERVVIVGTTASTQATFPDGDGFGTIPGADSSHNGGTDDAFVARLDLTATAGGTTPGFTASPTSGLVTTEAGGAATFTISLTTVPTAAVTVALASSDPTEGSVSPATLTFQPDSSAQAPQTVTVTGLDDSEADGAVAYTIVTAPAVSSDAGYNGLNPPDVAVSNQDNEVSCTPNRPAVRVTSTRGTTGTLSVAVQAGAGAITAIDFGTPRAFSNASITVAGGPANQTQGFRHTPAAGQSSVQFTVTSQNTGLATTVPLTVTDGCGAWQTFVGGGAGSF